MGWNRSSSNVHAQSARRAFRVPVVAWLVLGVILAAVAIGGFFLVGSGSPRSDGGKVAVRKNKLLRNTKRFSGSPEESVRKVLPAITRGKLRDRRTLHMPAELFDHLSADERRVAEAVQAALDADDYAATVPAVKEALKSSNPEVRQYAVEALGWFGPMALPELTGCMADSDDDIRRLAEDQWEQALQDVENPEDRFAITLAAFATLTDEDALTSLGGALCSAANEMIDGEDRESVAEENRLTIVQSLVDVIEGERVKNSQAAREAYNDITGNEWMGVDEAERYLADPDNYDPDERSVSGNEAGDDAGEEVRSDEGAPMDENASSQASDSEDAAAQPLE